MYLLLCLKNPATYYGYPDDEPIDIINIAINSDQAKNVFFKRLRSRVEKCPWFRGRFKAGPNYIEFDKNVTCYSGHSEREAFEGLNLIVAVLDEISGFAMESNTGNDRANTAHATYLMYRNSVDSRYPEFGKVILLSWSRFKGDYILQRYGGYDDPDKGIYGAVAEKEVIIRHHTFKLNEDLPDGIEGNEFSIEWEEDHITRYTYPGIFALRRPSWEVNPTKKIEDYKRAFYTNKADALGRFACCPSDSTDDTFFKNKQAIESTFVLKNGVDNDGIFDINFVAKPDKQYFVHVDLSKVHDRCAIAVAHVEKWASLYQGFANDLYPMVRVDALRWWKPSKDKPMDYKDVINFILELKRRNFNLKLVTFDHWNANDTMNVLQERSIETDFLSIQNQHYDDFLSLMYDERLRGPKVPELIAELKELRYIKGKVDHQRTGYKDCSDAVCGAIWNAVSRTPKPRNIEVEVLTYKKVAQEEENKEARHDQIIRPPRKMPLNLQDNMDRISVKDIRVI